MDFDLFVVGGGSGGVRAARIAGQHGAKVALAEQGLIGGTCVNVGCVPKKLLVMASHVRDEIDDAAGFGWHIDGARHDWPTLIARKDKELERLRGFYSLGLQRAGVHTVQGRARLLDPHTVDVAGTHYRAKHILIATGARAERPPIVGAELAIDSDAALSLPRLPEHIVIYGAGYIGLELAGVFRSLGARVTLVFRSDRVLRGFDHDVRETITQALAKRGVALVASTEITSLSGELGRVEVHTRAQSGACRLEADSVLFATGRAPNTAGLGLELAGVKLGARGEVLVDAFSCSSVPNIHAVGDVTDRMQLTPVAIAEGHALADSLFGTERRAFDHRFVPTAVFSQPTIATVGLTEEQARATLPQVHVYRTRVRPMKDTLGGREERAMFKLVVDAASDRVVGCHLVGPSADEIIQGFAVAIGLGVTKSQLDKFVGIHPSLAEDLLTIRERV